VADENAATNPNPVAPPPVAQSVNVTALPNAAVDTVSTPGTGTIAPVASPSASSAPVAAAASAPTAATPHGDNLAVRVYHGIMGALGGTQDTSFSRGPDGKMVVSQTPAGPGSQWKRIIAGVVEGTAAGLSAGPGPGQLERAAGAGMAAGFQGTQNRLQEQRNNADQDFNMQQKAMVAKAQTQALTYQGALASFQLSRAQVLAKVQDSDRENNFVRLIQQGGNGSEDLGVAQSFNDVLKLHKDMPNLVKENAQGNIIQVPHIDADGKFDGVRFALVTPQWKDAKISVDQSFYSLKPPTKPGEQPTIQENTVKAGTMTNGDFVNRQTAAGNDILKWQMDQQKEEDTNTRAAAVQKGETQRTAMTEAGANARTAMTVAAQKEIAATKAAAPSRAEVAALDKNYILPADTVEKSYKMMDHAYQEYKNAAAQGKRLPTGAQSMLALSTHLSTTFGNVKGSRVTKDMIQEHLGARSVSDAAKVAVQKLINGDALSPGQWEAFHDLIGESRYLSWEGAVKQARRKNIAIDFLPPDLSNLADAPNPGVVPPSSSSGPATAQPASGGGFDWNAHPVVK
jgi:hypothetical protein